MFCFEELESSDESDDEVPSLNDGDSSDDDDSIKHECNEGHSPDLVSAEQLLTDEIESYKGHSHDLVSAEQLLADKVTLAGVPISLDILFDKDV